MSQHPVRSWAPDDYLAAHEGWQSGWGDLPFAAVGRPVPATVQLGVLAHAHWGRLDDLRHSPAYGRPARTWGGAVVARVDRLLAYAPSAAALHRVQHRVLQVLERDLLDAGRVDLSRDELVALLDHVLAHPDAAPTAGRP